MSRAFVTRFAPSPTGLLHVGNARTALVAWLAARQAGGRYILRLDDTDVERSRAEFAEAIPRDLAWLGLDWDAFVRQSDRTGRYDEAVARLRAAGRLYPCYETAEELELKRRAALASGRPPVYDRAGLRLTASERAALEAAGRRPHWRFRLEHEPIAWDDLVRGPVRFEGSDLSDPVLVRADGRVLYHLGSVVDDIEMGITHVVRGEDHVANTAAHVQMTRALGGEPPAYAHLPLLTGAAGQALSKRLGSLSLQALRDEEGLEPMAVTSLLAALGTADPVEPRFSLAPLVDAFGFDRFGRAAPRFDADELLRLNARLLHDTPLAAVRDRLAGLGLDPVEPALWEAGRANLSRLRDFGAVWGIVHRTVAPVLADPALTRVAADLLPAEPWAELWDQATWTAWTGAVRAATGRSGAALFRPLRLALTASEAGPELRRLLPLIGRRRAEARLLGETA